MSDRTIRPTACPVCGGTARRTLAWLPDVPVMCNVLWPTQAEAQRAPRGDIDLVMCGDCGFAWNAAFDPGVVDYSQRYENCLAFSAVFRDYAADLARRLVERHGLRGKRVVEVGAGSGEFLATLCALGGSRGVGFDPSYDETRAGAPRPDNLEFIPDTFPPSQPTTGDFVVCRHVLEHVDPPSAVLDGIRTSVLPANGSLRGYFEVPDAGYMLSRRMLWDVIYEHCGYFAAPNLRLACERAGFRTLDVGTSFGGQYLWAEVELAPVQPSDPARKVSALLAEGAGFADEFEQTLTTWRERLKELTASGSVLVWGAGSKGAMFLNLVGRDLALVVDANPRKHGSFVPCSAQKVISPEDAADLDPDYVVVMNPLYVDEIRATLAAAGRSPVLLTV